MEERTCPRCGECFMTSHATKKYCSRQCGKAVQNAKRRGTTPPPKFSEFYCDECGKHCVRGKNVPHHASKFCGKQCSKANWKRRNPQPVAPRKLLVKSEGTATQILRWQSLCAARADIWKVTRSFRCPCCTKRVVSKSKFYCSNQCRKLVKRYRSKGRTFRRTWYSGMCRHCQSNYVTEHPTQRTCGASDCLRKSERLADDDYRKHAERHGNSYQPVDKVAVFLRDGLICQVCGVLCNPMAHPFKGDTYPTLGHIIAKSRPGGHHAEWNVQCECRRCNRDKSDDRNNKALLQCAQALARSKQPVLTSTESFTGG